MRALYKLYYKFSVEKTPRENMVFSRIALLGTYFKIMVFLFTCISAL
jgi:hypothetical protein